MPKLPIPTLRPFQQHSCNRSTTAQVTTPVLASTAATSASGTTIVVSSATWTTNQYQNDWVMILTGTGAGQTRNITSNTSTTLTVPTWTVTPDSTSTFQIVQPMYPGLQGSLMSPSTGGTVLVGVTYREVIPIAAATQVTVRLKTTTAAGTLTLTPMRLLAVNPDDPAIYLPDGSVDTTKVQKYATGGSSATAVVAGTELALSINPAGEAYCLVEFAVTTAGTLNYCDVMTLQSGGISSGGGGGGGGAVTGQVALNDGVTTTTLGTVKAASTPAAATDTALVVDQRPGTTITTQVLGNDNAGHYQPAGDNITRSIYVIPGNGAQSQPSMDAVARPGFQKITDGNTVVGVDAGTTSINVNIAKDSTPAATTGLPVTLTSSDLTTVVGVKAASTAAVATDPAIVVAISPNNGVTLSTGAAVKVTDGTNFQPTGDAAARAIFVKNTDGTNTGAVKAASTAAATTDPAQVVAVSPNNVVKVGDGTTSLVIKAASTAAVAGDTSAVVALSPNSPLPAGSSVIGTVSGTTKDITPTLAVTASAYAAGNCMGGKLTLTSAMRISGGTGTWQTLTITDAGNQKPLLDVLLFTSNPAGTFTDKSAFPTMSVADNALVLARISILSTDWVTFGGSAYCTKVVGAIPVTAAGSANLYAAMNVTSGTPTPTATTNLNAVFGFLCD